MAKLKPFFGKARQSFADLLNSKLVIGSFLENVFQSLFDHSRRSLLDFLNISNVLNVFI